MCFGHCKVDVFEPCMRTVGIYKNQDLVFCTGKVNSLVYNTIRGLASIGRELYNEKLTSIKIEPYVISIVEHSEEVFVFSIDDCRNITTRDFLDYACEVYKEYEDSGSLEVFQKILQKGGE